MIVFIYFMYFHHRKNFNAHQYRGKKQTTTGERVRGKVLVCTFPEQEEQKIDLRFFSVFFFRFSLCVFFGGE